MLPAVNLGAVVRDTILVLENERDFDDTGETGRHEGVAKNSVDHGRQRQRLRVSGHCETSEKNNDARNEVPLGPAVPAPAQPDTKETSTPPDDSHGSVL